MEKQEPASQGPTEADFAEPCISEGHLRVTQQAFVCPLSKPFGTWQTGLNSQAPEPGISSESGVESLGLSIRKVLLDAQRQA